MSDDQDLHRLRDLPRIALETGYLDVYRAYRGLPMDASKLRAELAALAPELGPLLRLFALGEKVARTALEPLLGAELVAALERLRVLLPAEPGVVHSGGMFLLPFLGKVVFLPALRHSPVALFGDDTAALAARLAPPRGARSLGLHAGVGALALHAVSLAAHVVAVEDSAVARAVAELNVSMNGLEDRIELRDGSAADVVQRGERFAHLAANPPLLPFPADLLAEPGSDQGGSPTERVLERVPDLLADGGVAQIIGSGLGDAGGPRLRALLETQASALAIALTVTSQVPLDSGRMLGALADSSGRAGVLSAEEAQRRMTQHLARTGCDRLFLFHLTISRGPRAGLSISRPDTLGGGYWSR